MALGIVISSVEGFENSGTASSNVCSFRATPSSALTGVATSDVGFTGLSSGNGFVTITAVSSTVNNLNVALGKSATVFVGLKAASDGISLSSMSHYSFQHVRADPNRHVHGVPGHDIRPLLHREDRRMERCSLRRQVRGGHDAARSARSAVRQLRVGQRRLPGRDNSAVRQLRVGQRRLPGRDNGCVHVPVGDWVRDGPGFTRARCCQPGGCSRDRRGPRVGGMAVIAIAAAATVGILVACFAAVGFRRYRSMKAGQARNRTGSGLSWPRIKCIYSRMGPGPGPPTRRSTSRPARCCRSLSMRAPPRQCGLRPSEGHRMSVFHADGVTVVTRCSARRGSWPLHTGGPEHTNRGTQRRGHVERRPTGAPRAPTGQANNNKMAGDKKTRLPNTRQHLIHITVRQ